MSIWDWLSDLFDGDPDVGMDEDGSGVDFPRDENGVVLPMTDDEVSEMLSGSSGHYSTRAERGSIESAYGHAVNFENMTDSEIDQLYEDSDPD